MPRATTGEPTAQDGPERRAADHRGERRTDAELVARLRAGDGGAYEELWSRHVAAALRVARRLAPNDAEDLVSEAFLAVHRRIVGRDDGAIDDFRAYLLAIVRNNAAKLHRDAARLPIDDDGEPVDERDGLALVEDEDGARTVLSAFKALPDRWQRMLWLAEVERAKRTEIAAHFGLRPNAVSVLHRRAKDGLRVEWLRRHVPEELLADPAHVADGIPAVIVGTAGVRERMRVRGHLDVCARCRDVDRELRALSPVIADVALSAIGFAALGVALPAASLLSPATAAAAASAALGRSALAGRATSSAAWSPSAGAVMTAATAAVALVASAAVAFGGVGDVPAPGPAPMDAVTQPAPPVQTAPPTATPVSPTHLPTPPSTAVPSSSSVSTPAPAPGPEIPSPAATSPSPASVPPPPEPTIDPPAPSSTPTAPTSSAPAGGGRGDDDQGHDEQGNGRGHDRQ